MSVVGGEGAGEGQRGGEREREKHSDIVTHLVGSQFLAKGAILLITLLLNRTHF